MIFISFSSQHLFPSGCTEKEIRSTLKEQEDTVDKEKDRQARLRRLYGLPDDKLKT